MNFHPHQPIPEPADMLRFACGHCGNWLQVAASLAGVRGPCPACGEDVTAPAWSPLPDPGRGSAAGLLAKPPPLRELPPPLAPVPDTRPISIPVRPILLPVEPEPAVPAERLADRELAPAVTASEVSAPVRPLALTPPAPVPANEIAAPAPVTPVPAANEVLRKPLVPKREKGIFAADTARERRAGEPRSAPAFRRKGWQRWLDLMLVAIFTGLLITCIAALRFTVPLAVKPATGLPSNLAEQIDQESKAMDLRRTEAELLARLSVRGYLGAASEEAAVTHLLPPPRGMAAPAFPPFSVPGLAADEFDVRQSRRIPGTDRFLVVIGPREREPNGPVFVVEQTDNGPRLHAGAITQQAAGLYEKFVASPGDGETTLYAEVRPAAAEGERDYRQDRPDLAGFRLVDVRSAFPTGAQAFIACFRPDSEAARPFARRAHDPGWRPVIVHVRWQRHREAGPFVELTEFIPGTWSGERVLSPAAATASINR